MADRFSRNFGPVDKEANKRRKNALVPRNQPLAERTHGVDVVKRKENNVVALITLVIVARISVERIDEQILMDSQLNKQVRGLGYPLLPLLHHKCGAPPVASARLVAGEGDDDLVVCLE